MCDDFWIKSREKGSSFLDDFIIGGVMGKGVTSCVYRCKSKEDDSDWACKVIQKEGQGKRKKVISSEIDALVKLRHPNIIEMRQIYESSMEVFIVLELADGGELFDRIVKKGHYSEKEAARLVQQVLSALEYSHSKGIVHRDIKPENILYKSDSDDSLIKISDFGFAKETDEHTIMQTFCGTIGYCAPEVIMKESYSSAVDIWSLGVVLYILLCGYEPFWDESGEPGVTRMIVDGDYEFESPYWDDISNAAKEFVVQMMTVDSRKRPNAKAALENPWVKGHTAQDFHLKLTQDRIRQFNAKRKFKGGAASLVVGQNEPLLLPPSEEQRNQEELYYSAYDFAMAQTPEREPVGTVNNQSPFSLGAGANQVRLHFDDLGRGEAGAGNSWTAPAEYAVLVPVSVPALAPPGSSREPVCTTGDTRSPEDMKRIAEDGVRRLLETLCQASHAPDPLGFPRSLLELRPHQLYGLTWAWWMEQEGASGVGGILADESGLGRTATMLALVCRGLEEDRHVLERDPQVVGSTTTLIICTKTARNTWDREVRKQYPWLKVLQYYGKPGRDAVRAYDAEKLATYDIVISTYDTVRCSILPNKLKSRDLVEKPLVQSPLLGLEWKRVVLDEGLNIKKHSKGQCRSACALQARHRWIMTGAGVPTMPDEMYAWIKFLRLQPFSDLEIWNSWMTGKEEPVEDKIKMITNMIMLCRTVDQM